MMASMSFSATIGAGWLRDSARTRLGFGSVIISSALVISFAPVWIRALVPLLDGESTLPGTANTSRPWSRAWFAVNSAPLYLRFAPAAELPHLMPLFWIGFSLLMLPATWAVRRVGGLAVMGAGALVGAVATRLAAEAGGLPAEVGAQLLCGGAWGCVAMSAVAAALTVGRPGREGALTGALFAGLALAAGTRIVLVAAKLPQNPLVAPILTWTPLVAWAVGGVAFLVAAWRARTVKTPA